MEGIPCGKNLCAQCCIEEYEICGASIDCDDYFTLQLFTVVASTMIFLGSIMSYLLYIKYLGGATYFNRMSQIILDKQYRKMKAEKTIGITKGIVVQKNAPIKHAEIVEGQSSSEGEEDNQAEWVGPVVPQVALYFDLTIFETKEERDKVITQYIERRN
jgi:hypothetical protein